MNGWPKNNANIILYFEVVLIVSQQEELPTEPSGFRMGNTRFNIHLNGKLNEDVVITIHYTAADLEAAGGNPMGLVLSRWNDVTNNWEILPTVVDTTAETLTVITNQFSLWAVMNSESSYQWWIIILGAMFPIIVIPVAFIIVKRRRSSRGKIN